LELSCPECGWCCSAAVDEWGNTVVYQAAPPPDGEPASPDDPYAVLGISPSATRDEIKARYRKLVSQNHPDLVASMSLRLREVAEEEMKRINSAYAALMSPEP
jgi:DnaJ-domain-containing protein 1